MSVTPPPPPPPSPPSPYAPGPVPFVRRPSPGMATASLVLGIVGVLLFFVLVPSVIALVLGLVAWSRARAAPGPGDGRARALAGWILGVVGVVAFLGLIIGGALAGWYDEDIAVNDLEVGQCVDIDSDAESVAALPERECDEQHDGEVYAVERLDAAGDDDFPGEESVDRQSQELCAGDVFEAYVGTPYLRSALEFYAVMPSEDSWRDGDRTVVCIAVRPDDGPLDESVEGSRR